MEYIAFDVHKHYTWATVESEGGRLLHEGRIDHRHGAFEQFLRWRCEPGSGVAVETVGNWYWVVDEIERAGFVPRLVNARLAKLLMGQVNKTDKLDNRGMNRLQRVGTLPEVWIPPGEVRDRRELPRARMALARQRTQIKNRVHAMLSKWGLRVEGVSDAFGKRGRRLVEGLVERLPPNTAHVVRTLLAQLDGVQASIDELESRLAEVFDPTPEIALLRTLPGVGPILSVVIAAEVGDVGRFGRAERLAAYAGTVPRIHASGGKSRGGPTRRDVNTYLKYAFVEAANATVLHRSRYPDRYVSRRYERLRPRRGHGKAVVAVARHLAESTWWVLTKGEPYRAPKSSMRG